MSKPSQLHHPIHLCRSGNGFQYNRMFPEGFPSSPGIPKQIRWSLGQDFEMARRCTEKLNQHFDQMISNALAQRWPVQRIAQAIERIREDFREILQHLHLPLGDLPTPRLLACANLAQGYERLTQACRSTNVLGLGADGFYYLKIHPSSELQNRLLFEFHRLDWCLDTTELEVACWKAAYIFQALLELERWEKTGHLHESQSFRATTVALHDYLAYVRKDHGFGLNHIPPTLPQSINELMSYPALGSGDRVKHLECMHIFQNEDGYFVLEIDFSSLSIPGPTRRLNLRSTSVINVTLTFTEVMHETGEIIDRLLRVDTSNDDAVSRAMLEIADLYRRHLDIDQGDQPYLPMLTNESDGSADVIDPAIIAAITAMAKLLPVARQDALQQLLNTPPPAYPGNELPSRALRFGQLLTAFSKQQELEQAWSHPKTRKLNLSRLNVLSEIVGADRVAATLTRAEVIKIRDAIRQYPRNRNKLFETKQAALPEVIAKGNYTPIHPRTGKQYFELLRRVLRYGLDVELIPHDPSGGLIFNTKGAAPPKRRTWNREQLIKVLAGPVYSLTEPPRWRMDDYKFWLPLLGIYQGARLNELCQLTVGDIREAQGIWFMSVNDDDESADGDSTPQKRLKNSQSLRNIPLHHVLIEAGFLQFVAQQRAIPGTTRATPLFHGLSSPRPGYSSQTASRWFLGNCSSSGGYVSQCGLGKDQLTFHGLRHTFINQARQQDLDILIIKALVGHTDDSVTGLYGNTYPLHVLNKVLQKIDYGIDTAHIHYRYYFDIKSKKYAPPSQDRILSCA